MAKNGFIVLIPHRDQAAIINRYRENLFAAGFPGAYSFPAAAPLAVIHKSFSRDELKELARNLRNLTLATDGKIQGKDTGIIHYSNFTFLGINTGLTIGEDLFPKTAITKIKEIIPESVICTALLDKSIKTNNEGKVLTDTPLVSFRAASVANLAIRPLGSGEKEYSFEWKIGPPAWLPGFH